MYNRYYIKNLLIYIEKLYKETVTNRQPTDQPTDGHGGSEETFTCNNALLQMLNAQQEGL